MAGNLSKICVFHFFSPLHCLLFHLFHFFQCGGCFTTYIVHFVRSWCRIFKSPISLYALIILFNTFNRDRQRWNSIDVNERAYVVRNNQVHLIPPFALLGEHGCVV